MEFDKVRMITDKFGEVSKLLGLEKGETTLTLSVEDDSILIGLQFDKREINEEERLEILKKINSLKKYLKINHIIINPRSIILQGN